MNGNHFDERRKFISDAFHSLNQPLTGLHCGLEIALQKPRSEGEYRKRIADGVENAGNILALVRAVRQLVDAADPGERFGTLSLPLVLSQVKSELELVSEATSVAVEVRCECTENIKADPAKLAACLGGLISAEMEGHERCAEVRVVATTSGKQVAILVERRGQRKSGNSEMTDNAEKLSQIRRSAGLSYIWTVGGEFDVTDTGLNIRLPIVKH